MPGASFVKLAKHPPILFIKKIDFLKFFLKTRRSILQIHLIIEIKSLVFHIFNSMNTNCFIYSSYFSEYLIKSKLTKLDMDWLPILAIISIFVIVLGPVFWLNLHFRGPIPDSGLRTPWETPKPKTKFEQIFGM